MHCPFGADGNGTAPDSGSHTSHGTTASGLLSVILSLTLLVGLIGCSRQGPPVTPSPTARPAPAAPPTLATAPTETNWPRFRGPGGLGIAGGAEAPVSWDGPSGKGVLWKSPVPLPGNSSPVLWGECVFLTGATEKQRQVYGYGTANGTLLWTAEVAGIAGSPTEAPEVGSDTGYAAPTQAADAHRVYSLFANGDLACHDHEGKPVWARSLGMPDNVYGHASSLLVWQELLVVLMDQGGAEEGSSKLMALSCATGDVVWEAARNVPNSWATPIVIQAGGREQLITCANPWVIAYSPADGAELWRIAVLGGDVAASPVYAGGRVLVANVNGRAAAIDPTGSGELPTESLLWSFEESLPDTCSPLATDRFVFLLTSVGILTCLDAATGVKLWDHDFLTLFRSSPSLCADRLYLLGQDGQMFIVRAGDRFEQLGTAALGEPSTCSPAFSGGRIYLRGEQNLYCVGEG